ncbi:ABC transporter permease [Micromonospora sp. DSM 115977]|uniref:ABC transporter permease n=1 Tax=Micromonospora reichwaldensis TaxID=3075516 RepID=A0ABU2X2G5_9ACTN|nr:ABC transporter permease [Micromonospora sp. DSM 115977]MDT0532341.1 ABC transporter permease [Micromonospora sp. DSM 115977]
MNEVTVRRPGPGSWLTLIGCEAKMVVRDTAGLVVPIGLPLLILVMNAAAAGDQEVAEGRSALEVFVLPLVFTIVLATIGIVNMPSFLAYYRRSGVLRRLAVTPASPAMVLVAQLVVSLAQVLVGIGLAYAVAVVGFGARPPADVGMALAVVGLSVAAMYGLGLIVASVAPTPNSAVAIGLIAFFALGAVGGLFGGTASLPEPVARAASWLPFGATVEALSSAWAGASVDASNLAGLAITAVVGATVAALLFRWN